MHLEMSRIKTTLVRSCVIAGILLTAAVSPVRAWWNAGWTARKAISIDVTNTELGSEVANVPVLLRLHEGDFQFSVAREDGSDLRFVASDDKTPLPFHIERYDSLLNEAFVWVKVPALAVGEKTTFWLYYGNGGKNVTKVESPKETYDADTILVYHFSEHGQPAYDFSQNANNAEVAGLPAAGSMIGGGLNLDGAHPVSVPASPTLQWQSDGVLTWSAWIKPASLQAEGVLFSRSDDQASFVIGVDQGVPYVESNVSGMSARSTGGAPIAAGSWHHLAVRVSGGAITVFLDGAVYGKVEGRLPALGSPLKIGAAPEGSSGNGFIGEIDELEISRAARPDSQIKFFAAEQGADGAQVISLGADEAPADPFAWLKGGYFGIIIGSLTVDGWVVIALLGVMSLISWFVMVNKISLLNGITKGNKLFLREWSHIANDLTILDRLEPDRLQTLAGRIDGKEARRLMKKSSVYKIYHIGAEEIRRRLPADHTTGSRVLSVRSIQAIRASLDRGVVRQTQKINNLIVLLTICISGGPFLGLLGTVVGVMITFAAVAAAGDVNVNAIAPGIAAALLATVAGLAVAIPSLFGYNYIVSRVKNATTDMHVFIDEFVTRMAEYYSDSGAPGAAESAVESHH